MIETELLFPSFMEKHRCRMMPELLWTTNVLCSRLKEKHAESDGAVRQQVLWFAVKILFRRVFMWRFLDHFHRVNLLQTGMNASYFPVLMGTSSSELWLKLIDMIWVFEQRFPPVSGQVKTLLSQHLPVCCDRPIRAQRSPRPCNK